MVPAIDARLTIQPTRLAQQRDRRLRHEEEPAQVHTELQVEMLDGQVLDAPADADPGRVDEQSSRPKRSRCFGDEPRAIVRVTDVGRDGDRAELRGCGLDLLLTPRRERQVVALVAQHPRDREPMPDDHP